MTKCAGCEHETSFETAAVIVMIDDERHICCTPHCLFDFARDFLKREMHVEDQDLLEAAASDLCQSLDGLGPDSPEDHWRQMGDDWERLGIVLGQLAPSPINYLRRSNGENV